MLKQDICPHHNGLTLALNVSDDLLYEIYVELALDLGRITAFKVEGLVTADVEIVAGEMRRVLIYKTLYHLDALLLRGVDGVVVHSVGPAAGILLEILKYTEMLILFLVDKLKKMSEGGKRGLEVDKVLLAVLVKLTKLGACEI